MSKWPMVKLGELFRKTKQLDPRRYSNDEFVLYSIPAYDNGMPENCTGSEIGSSKTVLATGDVLLSKIVPHIRRSWVVSDHGQRVLGSSEWIVLRDDRFDSNYLRQFLVSDNFHQQFMTTVAGVGGSLNRARPAAVARLEIPLPPLEEQQRIAGILEASSRQIARVQKELEFFSSISPSVMSKRFVEKAIDGDRDWEKISDLVNETQYGTSKKAHDTAGFPVLRMGNVTYEGRIDTRDLKYVELDKEEHKKYSLKNGDILFNRTNSAELVGKTAVYTAETEKEMTFAGYLIRARTKERASAEYVAGFLNSPYGKAYLRNQAKAIVGMANINAKEFLRIPIPYAQVSEQAEFSQLYVLCMDQLALLQRKRTLLEELHQSLATRAFAGEL